MEVAGFSETVVPIYSSTLKIAAAFFETMVQISSPTLKMEDESSSEIFVTRLHGITSQRIIMSILAALRNLKCPKVPLV
jgi:hypothetical protein